MSEQDSIVCPDCGAAYQCTPEQQGKLLHCKCGRYLVAGGHNQKSEPAPKPVAPVPPKVVPFGVKGGVAASPKMNSVPREVVSKPEPVVESQPGKSKNLMIGIGTVGVVALLVLAFMLTRPSAMASAARPILPDVSASPTLPVTTRPCEGAPLRLENGASLGHSYLGSGMGKLEIENAMPSDVAVRVTGSANLTISWVYVQQGKTVTINNVPLGTHRVLVASGSDWDADNLTFKCTDVYAQFEKPLEYIDRREDDRTTYSAYKLTLGKQRASMITREEFFKGHIGAGL